MIKKEQLVAASGLARALDGVKSELLKLAAIAESKGLEEKDAIRDVSVAVSRISLSLEGKARERYVAERQGKV
jgi:hypothetical protein